VLKNCLMTTLATAVGSTEELREDKATSVQPEK